VCVEEDAGFMKVKLVIVSPEVSPNEYDVVLPAKIGRGHEAKLKLVHPLVSRLHCELFADGERVVIRDLDSLNGTFVDQQRIDKDTPLASGATVMMGTVLFQVRYGKDADRLPPRPTVKMEKTAAAAGTVREETLNKISKQDSGASDEDLWEDRVEEPTAVVDPLGLASLDDEPNKKTPPRGPIKPANAAAKPKAAPPQKKAAAPSPPTPPPAAKPAPPSPAAKSPPAKPAPPADDEEDQPFNVAPIDVPPGEKPAAQPDKDDLDEFFNSIM
jgi:pSer/pThr/pTyr-binding forkhead associated (FHA) protein